MKHRSRTVSRLCTIAIVCGAFSSLTYGQSADSLRKKFDAYRSHTAGEKVYLHIDRSFYLTGETMWFKVYLLDASLHKLDGLSKVVYVEVVDANDRAVVQAKVEMKDGLGSGNLFLPATLNSAQYKLRAYTSLMRNYPPEFYFHTIFKLVNPFIKPSEPISISQKFEAHFFPEGGNLVLGLKSKVAFQVTDQTGKGIACKGAVLNAANDTIVKFMPLKFGIGYFYFTPRAREEYYAVISDERGSKGKFNLPAIKEKGFVIAMQEKENQLEVKVSRQTTELNHSALYMLVHTRNIISKAEVKFFQDPVEVNFQIDKSKLGDGISHILIFDENLQPVCERLLFKRPTLRLNPEIQTDSKVYEKRGSVKLSIGSKLPANISIAVYKSDSLLQPWKNGIAEYVMLSSDLKGTIEFPEYYFTENDPIAAEAADNLMLTHGWRRFTWDDVIKPKTPDYLPEYRNHVIKGIVRHPSGEPASYIITYLSSPSKSVSLNVARSNSKGEVAFQTKNLYDTRPIIIQTNPKKDSIYSVELTDPFSHQFTNDPLPILESSPMVRKQLLERSIDMQVTDIYRGGTSIAQVAIDSTSFYGKPYGTYLLDDYTRFPIMEEVFREYVKNVMVRKTKDNFHLYVSDMVNRIIFDTDPLILFDGVPVFDTDKLMALSPLKIRKIEVFDRKYFLGIMAFPGVVSCSTYQGDLAGFEIDGKKVAIDYEGLQRQTEYYSPKYPDQAHRESRMPDNRSLLFWKASVNVSSSAPAQIEFFTSDKSGNYQVVVEGISTEGIPGSATYGFEVKKQ